MDYSPLDDDDQTLFKDPLEHSSQHYPLDDAPLSPPHVEVDPLDVLPRHESDWDGDWGLEQNIGDTLEGLELNGNDSLSNSEIYDHTFGRANNTGTDADSSQSATETINPSWSPEFADIRIFEFHEVSVFLSTSSDNGIAQTYHIQTPSQNPNTAESSLPWRQLGHWSEGSYASLQPHTHALHNSSGATHSYYSDSAWETVPTTPSADDYDLRPIPDGNSASMQSYNDPRIGIWAQDNTYRQGQIYTPLMSMRHNNAVNPTGTRLLPRNLQEVCDNADAATPFATGPLLDEGALLTNAALGAGVRLGMAALSFPPLSTTGGPVTQFSQFPSECRSKALIAIDNTMKLATYSAERSPKVEHVFLPPGRDQKTAPHIAPTIVSGIPPFPATNMPPAVSLILPASTPSPSASSSAPTTGVAKCTHKGCRARFKGVSRQDTLRRHKLNVHSDKPKPTCPVCHLVIQSGRRDNWKRHIEDQHPGHPILESLNVRGKKVGLRTAVARKPARGKIARQRA